MTPSEEIAKVKEITETVAAALASREERYSVETKDSLVWTRMYIGAHKENAHFVIQIDLVT